MGDAQENLEAKFARVYVAPHIRHEDGKAIKVGGYYRDVDGRSLLADSAKRAIKNEARKSSKPSGSQMVKEKMASKPKGAAGTKEDPIVTGDVEEAAKLLGEGKWVRLEQERQVSTLLDKLAEIVKDAKEKGEKAPDYDLCRVSVKNTNLFCAESKGIPRVKMPQFAGVPIKGSKADHFPKNAKGKVDLSGEFAKHLQKQGIGYKETKVNAEFLKASQNQLNGEKVAGIANAFEAKAISPDDEPIWVSTDDYVVDGHHRWAAAVAYGIERGEDVELAVRQVDSDIITVLDMANKWTKEMGIPQADVTKLSGVVMGEKVLKLAKSYVAPHIRGTKDGTVRVSGYWRSLKIGSRVEVRHDLGDEEGTVTSVSPKQKGMARRVTVRFDDGTESSWSEDRIVSVNGEDRDGSKMTPGEKQRMDAIRKVKEAEDMNIRRKINSEPVREINPKTESKPAREINPKTESKPAREINPKTESKPARPKRSKGISAETAARLPGVSPWAAADDPVRESRYASIARSDKETWRSNNPDWEVTVGKIGGPTTKKFKTKAEMREYVRLQKLNANYISVRPPKTDFADARTVYQRAAGIDEEDRLLGKGGNPTAVDEAEAFFRGDAGDEMPAAPAKHAMGRKPGDIVAGKYGGKVIYKKGGFYEWYEKPKKGSKIAKLARVYVSPHVRMYEDEPVMVGGYYRDVPFMSESFEPTMSEQRPAGDLRLGDVITDPNGYSGLITSVNRWKSSIPGAIDKEMVEVAVDYGPDRIRGTGRRESFRMPSSKPTQVIGKVDVAGGREMPRARDLRGLGINRGDDRIPMDSPAQVPPSERIATREDRLADFERRVERWRRQTRPRTAYE
jgi:hypothetical protein